MSRKLYDDTSISGIVVGFFGLGAVMYLLGIENTVLDMSINRPWWIIIIAFTFIGLAVYLEGVVLNEVGESASSGHKTRFPIINTLISFLGSMSLGLVGAVFYYFGAAAFLWGLFATAKYFFM